MNRRQASLRIVHEINLGTDLTIGISARKHASGLPRKRRNSFEEDNPFIQEIRGDRYKRL